MKLFKTYRNNKNKNYHIVYLQYSWIYFFSHGRKWFCRIWDKKFWNKSEKQYGESFGKTKFKAYRNAINDLNNK